MTRRALLLAAGLATRLGSLRQQHAKACVPVAGTSPLRFLIQQLMEAGVEELWNNLHHRGDQVRAAARDAVATAGGSARLNFLEERRLLGTGGTLLRLTQELGALPDLVVNAKLFTDLDWTRLLQQPPGCLVVHPPSSLSEFGGLHFDAEQRLLGLRGAAQAADDRDRQCAVYTGIARPAATWLAPLRQAEDEHPEQALCLARDGFLRLAGGDEAPRVLPHHGFWCEISTPRRVAEARRLLHAYVADDPSGKGRFGIA